MFKCHEPRTSKIYCLLNNNLIGSHVIPDDVWGVGFDQNQIIECFIFPLLFFRRISDFVSRCMDDRLTPFYSKALEFNAHIQHISDSVDPATVGLRNQRNIPYVGNGYFGIEIGKNSEFYVKYGRHLSQVDNFFQKKFQFLSIVHFRFRFIIISAHTLSTDCQFQIFGREK